MNSTHIVPSIELKLENIIFRKKSESLVSLLGLAPEQTQPGKKRLTKTQPAPK